MCKSPRLIGWMFVLLLVLGPAESVWAQDMRGTISGRVLDESEGVIPGTTVTVTNMATGVEVDTLTNDEGSYHVRYLNPGPYQVKAALPGFKTTVQVVELRISEHLQIDVTLTVGEMLEEVTVLGATPLLETANANMGTVMDSRRVSDLPLAQGNPTFLLKFAAGVTPGSSTSVFKFEQPMFDGVIGGFQFEGAPRGSTAFTLDGANNSVAGRLTPITQPPTEAVEEFKISHSFDATRGHNSGTSIDLSLKSGTNEFHGSGFFFIRDDALNANSFLSNRTNSPKPPLDYNRWGWSVTGPVFKDKTFFAWTYENTEEDFVEAPNPFTVPTEEQNRGDFSKLLELGPEFQIYDPLTTTPTGDGFFQREPFANNIIPDNRIHPISRKLMEHWPAPNQAGAPDGTDNYQPVTSSPRLWWQNVIRVDHTFNANHRIFAHHSYIGFRSFFKEFYPTLGSGHRQTSPRQSFTINDVYVVDPKLLFNFSYSVTRLNQDMWDKSSIKDDSGGFDITTLGLSDALVQQLDLCDSCNGLPHVFIDGHSGLRESTRARLRGNTTHAAKAQADLVRGNHSLKMGFEFRSWQDNDRFSTFAMPRYQFGTNFTRGPLNVSPAAPTGQGFAAFLLGQPTGGSIWRRDSFAAENPSYSLYLQDDWRVTPKLTINIGLRYEYYGSVVERYNRSVRGFDFNASSPIEADARAAYAENPIPEIPVNQFGVQGGLTFAGVGGQPEELFNAPDGLLAPRFGFAYRLGKDTVLRGGYGLFQIPNGLGGTTAFKPNLTGFSRQTSLIPSFDNGVTFVADIEDPFPDGILDPEGVSGGLSTFLGQSISFFNTDNLQAPYNQRWSLTLQQMLPNRTLLDIAYVGSRTAALLGSRNLNFLPEQYLSTQPSRDQETINFLRASVPNPFAGLIPGSSLNTQFTSREQLLKPVSQFKNVATRVNQGYSWYHALETKIEKRFSRGHTYVLSYTWSKNMEALSYLNPSDPVPHEVVSAPDRTHVLSLTGIWELPFGRGKAYGSNAPSGISKLISGWQLSGMYYGMTGFPLTFSNDLFFNGNIEDIPLPESQRDVNRWFNTDAGFVRGSAKAPAFHLRTFPLRLNSLRTDGLSLFDLSVIKNTHVSEDAYIQFRAEFFNAFNHTNFARVRTDPRRGNFGRVRDELTNPRAIQFGVKFIF